MGKKSTRPLYLFPHLVFRYVCQLKHHLVCTWCSVLALVVADNNNKENRKGFLGMGWVGWAGQLAFCICQTCQSSRQAGRAETPDNTRRMPTWNDWDVGRWRVKVQGTKPKPFHCLTGDIGSLDQQFEGAKPGMWATR